VPRKAAAPPSSPTLPPEKAIPILEGLVRESDEIGREPRDSPRRSEWWHNSLGALQAAFGDEHEIVQQFGIAGYSFSPASEDETRQGLSAKATVLQSAITQLRWRLPDSNQIFLPAGSQHDAFVEIRKIVQQATKELFIVDPWVDHTLWPLLTNIPNTCKIRVLTEHTKGDFLLEAKRFVAQHGVNLEVRRTAAYHDRFVVLDGARCFHLGASIKDAGNKAFALSEFQRPTVVQAAIADADSEWRTSTVVPF